MAGLLPQRGGGSKDNVLKDSSPDKVHVLHADMIAETGPSSEAEVEFPGSRQRNWLCMKIVEIKQS